MENEIASLESQCDALSAELRETRLFFHRHQSALTGSNFNRNDVASLEMLGGEHDLAPGNEDFKTFAANATRAIGQKLSKIGESIAIFFDSTGKKELNRLRRDVEELGMREPRNHSISDRNLTNGFTIGTTVITDLNRELERVTDFINSLTDDYVPAVLDRDHSLWAVMGRSGYLSNGSQESLEVMIDDLMAAVAKNTGGFLSKLPDNGTSLFIGNRHLMLESHPPTFRLERGAQDPDTLKVHKAYTSLTIASAGRAGTRVTAQSHSGVLPTLDPDGLRQHLEIIAAYTTLLERVVAIYRGTRGTRIQSEIQVVLSSAEELEEFDVAEADGTIVETVVTSNLDRADASRLKLLADYLTHSQFQTADLMINATHLIVSLWRSHVDYVKASMKQYR